ncbi:MAG TPA: LysM peptidoglycan-binding domain-containing protein [Gemmatimonadota bacterium]|jgi:membrane-bound lytic murein transglycosylase D
MDPGEPIGHCRFHSPAGGRTRRSTRARSATAGAVLLAALLLAGCASSPPPPPVVEAPPPPPAPAPPAAPALAAPPDTLSTEEARDLEALQAETFKGPVGSTNADLDDDLERFLKEESDAILTETVDYDIPIVINERVEYFIDYFQNRVRKSFAKWLVRAPQVAPYMRARFQQEGLPEDLIYISLIESGFSAQATSRARAVGYWQFIAGTARRYGLRVDRWVDERRDIERSTEAAIAYLKELHQMFGSWYLAAAAYNSGEGRIQKAIDRSGSENLWELAELSNLRNETKDYVPKLIAATMIAKEPAKYGFAGIPQVAPLAADTVTVPTPADLRVIAAAAGTNLETIRALNPSLRSHSTPPGVTDFPVLVPRGSGASFRERIAQVPASKRLVEHYHVVRRGETPNRIAAKYGVSTSELMEENEIRNPRALRVGQRLRIPDRDGGEIELPVELAQAPAPPPAAESPPAAGANEPAAAEIPPTSGASSPAAAENPPVVVENPPVVVENPPVAAENPPVAAAHPPASGPDNVQARVDATGLDGEPTVVEAPAGADETVRYRVKKGDTLYHIALEYGVGVNDLRRWNPSIGKRIYPGTVLLIHPPAAGRTTGTGGSGAARTQAALEGDRAAVTPAGSEGAAAASPAGPETGVIADADSGGAVGSVPAPATPDLSREMPAPVDADPADPADPAAGSPPADLESWRPGAHVLIEVEEGDTLLSIAQRHNVTADQVRVWNGIRRGDALRPGDRLILFPPTPVEPQP